MKSALLIMPVRMEPVSTLNQADDRPGSCWLMKSVHPRQDHAAGAQVPAPGTEGERQGPFQWHIVYCKSATALHHIVSAPMLRA